MDETARARSGRRKVIRAKNVGLHPDHWLAGQGSRQKGFRARVLDPADVDRDRVDDRLAVVLFVVGWWWVVGASRGTQLEGSGNLVCAVHDLLGLDDDRDVH